MLSWSVLLPQVGKAICHLFVLNSSEVLWKPRKPVLNWTEHVLSPTPFQAPWSPSALVCRPASEAGEVSLGDTLRWMLCFFCCRFVFLNNMKVNNAELGLWNEPRITQFTHSGVCHNGYSPRVTVGTTFNPAALWHDNCFLQTGPSFKELALVQWEQGMYCRSQSSPEISELSSNGVSTGLEKVTSQWSGTSRSGA
jgi:hypothetical protein